METSDRNLVVFECGDSLLVERRIVFDLENKYCFCCDGKRVRVIAIEGGQCSHALDHPSDVIGVSLDDRNSSILTCTVDGIISQWDYENGVKVKQWEMHDRSKLLSFMVPRHHSTVWFIVASSRKGAQLYAVTRRKDELSLRLISKVPEDRRLLSVHNKAHFAAYAVGGKLWIVRLDNEEPQRCHDVSENDINVVVCHPTKDSVAVGNTLGKIYIWHKVLGERPVSTAYHWHSLPVSDIVFSNEGTTMYSGGKEMVVVQWPLQSSSKEESKGFLPRMGAKIRFLTTSQDGSLIGICLDDNSIQIASSQLKIVSSIAGFSRYADVDSANSQHQPPFAAGLVFDGVGCGGASTKGSLVTNGRHGHLQFYDPRSKRQTLLVDVVGRNLPPAERGRELTYSEAIQVALCDGWLATVDHRADPMYSDETSLKFWKYDEQSNSFKLNTWVDRPHSDLVTSLFFRPQNGDEPTLISTAIDGKFRVWEISREDSIYNKASGESWICDRVGYYRGQPALCGDFSLDGQLGIGFGCSLTLWDFEELQVSTVVSVSACGSIRKLQFGTTEDDKHLAVVLSDKDLTAWDVSSHLCLWRVTTKPDLLCKHVSSGLFAAFFGSKICLFRSSSPEPTQVMGATGLSRGIAAAFGYDADDERGTKWDRLYFITDTQKLMCLGNDVGERTANQTTSDTKIKRTPFAELLAASKASKQALVASDRYSNYEANIQLLSGPAHALPSVASIGPKFVESSLGKRNPKEQDDEILIDPSSQISFAYLKTLYSE